MSWDIHFQDFPDVATIQDIPHDYVPNSIGTRGQVIDKIKSEFPRADFTDPSWGRIDGTGWSIEVNIGPQENCEGFMLHVRGGIDAMSAVSRIATSTGLRGIDMQTSQFFESESANESFGVWQNYRDQVVEIYSEPLLEKSKKHGFFGRLFRSD